MSETPETILNVNDNEAARYATTRILHRAGFKVLEAATGSEALQITREDLPPLVILDINLPDLSGVEVCRRIKTDPATALRSNGNVQGENASFNVSYAFALRYCG